MKRVLMPNLFFALATFTALFSMTPGGFAQSQEVPIGVIIPLAGENAVWGEDAKTLVEVLGRRWSGTGQRYHMRFMLEDGRCGAGNAPITAGKKLVELGGVRFILAGCSGEVLQLAPYAEQRKVLVIAYSAGHADISKAGDYIFRTYLNFNGGVQQLAKKMAERNNRSIAILTEENSFTASMKKLLTETLKERVVYEAEYAQGDADLKPFLFAAKGRNSDAYYLNTVTPHSFTVLFRQLRQAGINAPVYAYYNPGDRSVREALGPLLRGTTYLDVPDFGQGSGEFQEVLRDFLRLKPAGPETPFLLRTAYDALAAIKAGIEAVGPDAAKVKDFLYKYQAAGASGEVKFDANGDRQGIEFAVREVE